jgi:hypothetical protein
MEGKTEKKNIIKKNSSKSGLTQLTCNMGYEIEIIPHKKKQKNYKV